MNTSDRLLCFNVGTERIDVMPGVVTDNKSLDKLKKDNDKIFMHYLETGALKEVKGDSKKSSKKETKEVEA